MEGKQITTRTAQDEREEQKRNNLLEAIAKLTWLGKHFCKSEHWEKANGSVSATEYKDFAQIIEDNKQLGDSTKDTKTREAQLIKSVLYEVEELSHHSTNPEFYKGHPVYEYAQNFLAFLNISCDEANQPEATNTTQKGGRRKKERDPVFISYFDDKSKYPFVLQVLRKHQQQQEAAPAAKIILAAQQLGYIRNNIPATTLYRALKPLLEGLASARAFREAWRTGNPDEYKEELKQAQQ